VSGPQRRSTKTIPISWSDSHLLKLVQEVPAQASSQSTTLRKVENGEVRKIKIKRMRPFYK